MVSFEISRRARSTLKKPLATILNRIANLSDVFPVMPKQPSTKSRDALVQAFTQLVVERVYRDFHIADIVSRADVSRSTFYMYFGSKEDILRECLGGIVDPLAAAGFDDDDNSDAALIALMDHLCDVRVVAVAFLAADTSSVVVQMLADAIAKKLATRDATKAIPQHLIAYQMAESTIGLLRAWLNHFETVGSDAVARQLRSAAQSLASAY